MAINKQLILLITACFTFPLWACQISNLTDQAMVNERIKLFEDNKNPGVRLAITELKSANKKFGLGSVNTAIDSYEKRLCDAFKKNKLEVKVVKTDFKGYFIQCSPMPNCLSQVESVTRNIPGPNPGKGEILPMKSAQASNYREGYIRARIQESYPDAKGSLPEFIQKEIDQGIKEAKQAGGNTEAKLLANIDLYRSKGEEAVDPAFKRVVRGLDQLLETPFASANNIDHELDQALKGAGKKVGAYQVSTALTGDDLFVVIKSGDKIEKVIGVDARGLGSMNMLTRYQEFLKLQNGKGQLDSMDKVFDLSQGAMKQADHMMESSFKSFNQVLTEELAKGGTESLELRVQNAHLRYQELQKTNPNLMKMRSGFIAQCDGDRTQVMNRITAIHNQLKELEAKGIDEFYPTSCLGAQYLLLRN